MNEWFDENRILIKPKENQPHGKISSIRENNIQSVLLEENGHIKMFMINQTPEELKNITIYTNKGKENLNLGALNWRILHLGDNTEIKFVDIFINDLPIRKWDLSTEENYNKFIRVNKIEYK